MAKLNTVPINETFYKVIPSRFPTVRLFDRISKDHHDQIAKIETLTNPRVKELERLLSGADVVDVNNPRLQNFNRAPFAYRNPEGTRYFRPELPALDLAYDRQSALLMAISGRENFLAQTGEPEMALEMRELCRPVVGNFADLRHLDPMQDREDRWRIGDEVANEGFDGLLYCPAERPSANCVAVLKGETLGKVDQGDHFKFFWNGKHIVELYSFGRGKLYEAAQLASTQYLLDAA